MDALFREEAVSHKARSVFGGVLVRPDRAMSLLSALAVALACALLAALITGTYAPKERVAGHLVPARGTVQIHAPRDGAIAAVHVHDGRQVRPGQALVTVRAPVDTGAGRDADAAHIDSLIRERRTLEARLRTERAVTEQDAARIARKVESLRASEATVEAQLQDASARVELLQRDVQRLEALAERGHVAASMLDSRLLDALEARERVRSLEGELARLREETGELEAEHSALPLRLDLAVMEVEARKLALERELAGLEARWARVVRAPSGGTVTALRAHDGMQVTVGQRLLTLLPEGARMRAEMFIPTHAAGFVAAGQEVRLRLDAFPHRKFGLQRATLTSVDRAVLVPEDLQGPTRPAMPVYRALAELDAQHVIAYGEPVALRAGMTLEADIVRDRRRIIEWLYDPVLAAFGTL